jgi:hypothetical protein
MNIDDIINAGSELAIPIHQKKTTILELSENGLKQSIYRKVSLNRYKLNRFILNSSPKPISRIFIVQKNDK